MKRTRKRTFYLTPEQHRKQVCETVRALLKDKKKVLNSSQFTEKDAILWYNPMISYVIRKHKRYIKQYNESKEV